MKEHLNRIALVTGGSSGIGRGAAIELARNGSAVAIHGRDLAEAESVAQLILDFFERFDFWRIYPRVVTIVLVRRCRLVVLYGLLGVRLHEPLLHRGRLLCF